MTKKVAFTKEYEREAVRVAETNGRTRREVADDLGIGLSTLTRWLSRSGDVAMDDPGRREVDEAPLHRSGEKRGPRTSPPLLNGHIDWTMISQARGIEAQLTAELKKHLRPGLDAIIRWLGAPPTAEERRPPKSTVSSGKMAPARKAASASSTRKPQCAATDGAFTRSASTQRGPAPKAVGPFPEALFEATNDPASFQDALIYHMRRFGDTYWQLHRAVVHLDETFDSKTLLSWMQGERVPRSVASFNILRRIEWRYRLQEGYARTSYSTRRARFMVMISAISARLSDGACS